MTFFYDINRRLADLDQIKPILNESQHVDEKYMGFDKTVAAIKKGGSADDPEAVAAAIGRKKYGKERFQKAAAAGKKLGEQQGVAEGSLNEFAQGGDGDYLRALASAWYNDTFNTGSLQQGIKSQEDVERVLARGIVCPDGKTRKYNIDYNGDFDGVQIYSDDYYEHGDVDGSTDTRTGRPFGPYDHIEFKGQDLNEGIAEGSLEEVSLDLAKRARDKAEYFVDMDYDDMRDRPYGYSEKQRSKFQRYIDRKEPRAKGDRDWDPPKKKGVAEGTAVPWQVVINALASGYPDSDPTDSLAPIMRKYGVEFDDLNLLARRNGYNDIYAVLDDFGQKQGVAEGKGKKPDYIDLDGDGKLEKSDFAKLRSRSNEEQLDEKMYFDPATGQTTDRTFKPPVGGFKPPIAQSAPVDNTQFKADVDRAKSGLTMKPGDPTVYSKERGLGPTIAADRLQKRGVDIPGLVGNRINPATLDADFGMYEDDVDEGNEFSGELAKAKASGAKEFEVDGKTYPVKEGRSEKTAKGLRHHGTYGTDYQGDDDEDTDKKQKHVKHDRVGRPSGPKHTYDEPFGTVKVPAWKGPKTVHKIGDNEPGKEAPRRGRPKKVREQHDDMIDIVDRGEYDREGDMAHDQLRTIVDAAKELRSILKADENLPEWVQSKITKALDYIDTARDYMKSQKSDLAEPIAEKAVSQAQQQAAAIALKARRSGKKLQAGTASAEMAKMPKAELEKFASTARKGLPKHKDKEVKETTTSGSVAVADAGETKKSKGKGNMSFGQGIYDSWNRELEQMISESMNITVSQNTSETGELEKSISINATGDDADRLAELLNLSGMHDDHSDHSCPTCNQEPYGCAEMVDENSPDWPTNTEYNQDALQYSGGLNRPKTTGQTTVPVIASQLDRQMSENNELDYIKKMLG